MILFRPMDLEELRLVYGTGMRAFPPRRPEQPVFYPILSLEYANEIAERWNAENSSAAGYVARFGIEDTYGALFEPHVVGASYHAELWVPSEELARFNEHIIPPITVVSTYFGPKFRGYIPDRLGLRGKDATGQFLALARTFDYSGMDFRCEILANHVAVFLNYAFWAQNAFSNEGISESKQQRVLTGIQGIWSDAFASVPLPFTVHLPAPATPVV